MERAMLRFGQKQTGCFFAFVLFLQAAAASAALPLTQDNQSPFALVYQKVSPAVVLIEVESDRQSSPANPWDRYFNVPSPDRQAPPSEGMGSGVIFDQKGYVLTNNHVVEDASRLTVRVDHDLEYDAVIVGRDPQTDLAVIQIQLDGDTLPPERVAVFGDSDKLQPGDYAIAIGNPMGLERTITVGVISGLGRYELQVQGAGSLVYRDFIQTDAQINPGNSGGALVNIDGEVIGINNMYAVQYAAIGFAIPINMAQKVATQLVANGSVKRGMVGIRARDVTREIRDEMQLPALQGILITEVTPGLPAEKAGIEKGDLILSLDGQSISNYNDFLLRIGERLPGETVALKTFHAGQEKTVEVILAERQDEQVATDENRTPSTDSWLGITVADIDTQIARRFNLRNIEAGVIIVMIDEGSPAEEANLQEGEVITEIEGQMINNTGDFARISEQYRDSEKNILIYRMRRLSDGRFSRGYVAVAVKSK